MPQDQDPPPTAPPAPEEPQRTYTSTELFQGRQEIRIEHDGVVYLLRITRKNRLILHK